MNKPIVGGIYIHDGELPFILGEPDGDYPDHYGHFFLTKFSYDWELEVFMPEDDVLVTDIFADIIKDGYENS